MTRTITCPNCGRERVERISFGKSVKTQRCYWTIACKDCSILFLWTPKGK